MPFKSSAQRAPNLTSFQPGHVRTPEGIEKQKETMKRQITAGERTLPRKLPGTPNRPGLFGTPQCDSCGDEYEVTGIQQKWCRACVPHNQARRVMQRYGLSWPGWQAMWELQRGLCEICAEPLLRPHVDHDHNTGLVRALLCSRCNTLVGWAENTDLKARVETYLARERR